MSKITRGCADAPTRFWSRVTKTGSCWLWGAGTHRSGYGLFKANGKQVYAHRYAYELQHGPIPAGLEVDHTCHNEDDSCPGGASCSHRRCVNPAHLEPVTHAENGRRGKSVWAVNARKTHCPQDHEYSPENTLIERGARVCRTCRREREASRRRRKTRKATDA
jgi:hypothetical protein